MKLNTIKLIACDIDGVLVADTFSPILRNVALKFGCDYTREVERNVFSQRRKEGREYMMRKFNIQNIEELRNAFLGERESYIRTNDCGVLEGVPEFLELIFSLGVHLVCYGGLDEEDILDDFKKYMHYFYQYICTNDFRPGIKEITKDIYGLEYNQVLFIDDVNTVAEDAKSKNVPFIGIPSDFPYGFQRQDMIDTNVKYILNSVKEIDEALLEKIDNEAALGTIWKL